MLCGYSTQYISGVHMCHKQPLVTSERGMSLVELAQYRIETILVSIADLEPTFHLELSLIQ